MYILCILNYELTFERRSLPELEFFFFFFFFFTPNENDAWPIILEK